MIVDDNVLGTRGNFDMLVNLRQALLSLWTRDSETYQKKAVAVVSWEPNFSFDVGRHKLYKLLPQT